MAVIHKGVDKIIDSSANEVVIATVKATIDNQVNKSDVGHSHNINDLTDIEVSGASVGQVLSYTSDLNSTGVPGWEPATVAAVGDSYTKAETDTLLTAKADSSHAHSYALNDITDVTTTGAVNGQVLTYNGTSWGATTVTSGGGGANQLDELSDVDLATNAPQTNEVLQYNGSQWVPAAVSSGGSSNVAVMDDLTDVDTTTTAPTDQQVLAWDASNSVWSPTSFSAASGSGSADLGIAVTTAGGDVDYEFNAATPSGVPSMDTTSLAVGSTMMWNGSSWVDSGLVIETYT